MCVGFDRYIELSFFYYVNKVRAIIIGVYRYNLFHFHWFYLQVNKEYNSTVSSVVSLLILFNIYNFHLLVYLAYPNFIILETDQYVDIFYAPHRFRMNKLSESCMYLAEEIKTCLKSSKTIKKTILVIFIWINETNVNNQTCHL